MGMTQAQGGGQCQATPRTSVTLKGKGLFHGIFAKLTLRPAPEDHGLVFRRTDLPGKPRIPASVACVVAASRRTVLSIGGAARVETTEHLLAALGGLGITNCLIDLSAPEVPAVDGSALPFCELILQAGIFPQRAAQSSYTITEPIAVAFDGGKQRIEITGGRPDVCAVSYRLEFGEAAPLAPQFASVVLTGDAFLREIAAARTFIFESEIEALQAQGFGKHLTASDLVIFSDDGTPIGNSLRWADEAVRHKILDCVGDLTLSGGLPFGHVYAHRSGHALNHVMARVLQTGSGFRRRSSQAA